MTEIEAIEWVSGRLKLLDQTKLPHQEVMIFLEHHRDVALAIRDMKVRGAPALGVTAGFGMAIAASHIDSEDVDVFLNELRGAAREIVEARPTAVNVSWATTRMLAIAEDCSNVNEAKDRILNEALEMQSQDKAINRLIGKYGADLLTDGGAVLTHCNTGSLATAGYGTALGVIRGAWEQGKRFKVFHTETRPYLQGARLTSWELLRLGIPGTMIVDSAAGLLLKDHHVESVVVGADRIAANGDTANKIGTYTLAVLARENKVPFYVVAPTSTIDLSIASGDDIPIEERDHEEVSHLGEVKIVPDGVQIRNPAFDVTPHSYIDAIVTESGIVRAPYVSNLVDAVRGY